MIDESGRKDRRTTEHTLARTLRQRVRVGAYRAVDALRESVSVGVRAEAFQIRAACLSRKVSRSMKSTWGDRADGLGGQRGLAGRGALRRNEARVDVARDRDGGRGCWEGVPLGGI